MVARHLETELELLLPVAPQTRLSSAVQRVRDVFRGAPVLSLLFLAIALICVLFAPHIAPYNPVETLPADILATPNLFSNHTLGADNQGRDILSRLIYGAQISVQVGVLSVLLAAAVGCSRLAQRRVPGVDGSHFDAPYRYVSGLCPISWWLSRRCRS